MATGMERTKPPLIVIVGPTASGKTLAAISLAERIGGEIICADSRTIYREMDIGTAKPSVAERASVPHWGLDLVNPDQAYNVSDFKRYADEKINEIKARGKIPILAGGTGLYTDAVIFDFQFGDLADKSKRAYLENLSIEELYLYCKKNNINLPENQKNKRYVVRAIERNGVDSRRSRSLKDKTIVVGIATEKAILQHRITERSEQIFTNGVVNEAIKLGKKYDWNAESMTGNIYPLIHSYLKGEATLEIIQRKFEVLDWGLAKRQLTWFRRNPYIIWHCREDVIPHIETVLADYRESCYYGHRRTRKLSYTKYD